MHSCQTERYLPSRERYHSIFLWTGLSSYTVRKLVFQKIKDELVCPIVRTSFYGIIQFGTNTSVIFLAPVRKQMHRQPKLSLRTTEAAQYGIEL